MVEFWRHDIDRRGRFIGDVIGCARTDYALHCASVSLSVCLCSSPSLSFIAVALYNRLYYNGCIWLTDYDFDGAKFIP